METPSSLRGGHSHGNKTHTIGSTAANVMDAMSQHHELVEMEL